MCMNIRGLTGRWSLLRALGVTAAGMLVHLISNLIITLLALLLSHGLTHATNDWMARAGGLLLLALAAMYLLFPAVLDRWYSGVS